MNQTPLVIPLSQSSILSGPISYLCNKFIHDQIPAKLMASQSASAVLYVWWYQQMLDYYFEIYNFKQLYFIFIWHTFCLLKLVVISHPYLDVIGPHRHLGKWMCAVWSRCSRCHWLIIGYRDVLPVDSHNTFVHMLHSPYTHPNPMFIFHGVAYSQQLSYPDCTLAKPILLNFLYRL